MRFAIATSDNASGIFNEFLRAGWEPVKLFAVPVQGSLDSSQNVIALAQSKHISVQVSRMTEPDLADLGESGCEALIVADYKWRIGNWRPHLKYAANFHPSPLPEARGPYPMVRAILENRKSWAVSCHRLEPDFDTGAIMAAEPFGLDDNECLESLKLKIQMASERLANRVACNFSELWELASPQGAGDYWPNPTPEDQTVHFSCTVEVIMRQLRAFGFMGCLAHVNGVLIYIRRAVAWKEAHNHPVGSVAHVDNKTIVVAARDGYIGIIEWSMAPSDLTKVLAQQP